MAIAGYNFYENGVKLNASLLTIPNYVRTGLPTPGSTHSCYFTAVDTAGNESSAGDTKSVTLATVPDGNITPEAPILTANDTDNTLSASHALGSSEIVVSVNDGAYTAYTGVINVGDVARPEGYWKFKIKAAVGRNESAVASSPAFTTTARVELFTENWSSGTIDPAKWEVINPTTSSVSFYIEAQQLNIESFSGAVVAAYENRIVCRHLITDGAAEFRHWLISGSNDPAPYMGFMADSTNRCVFSRISNNLRVLITRAGVNEIIDLPIALIDSKDLRVKAVGNVFSFFYSTDNRATWIKVTSTENPTGNFVHDGMAGKVLGFAQGVALAARKMGIDNIVIYNS